MSGYILHLLLLALIIIFWRARAGRTFDQLMDASNHHHHQVLAAINDHPKGGSWSEHKRWMADRTLARRFYQTLVHILTALGYPFAAEPEHASEEHQQDACNLAHSTPEPVSFNLPPSFPGK